MSAQTKQKAPIRAAGAKAAKMPLQVRLGASSFQKIRADFYEDLAAALEDRAVLAGELLRRKQFLARSNPSLAALFGYWLQRMDSMPFSDAIKGTVPTLDGLIISASEAGGSLASGLAYVAKITRNIEDMKSAVMAAVFVPALLAVMMLGMLLGYSFYLVPVLEAIMEVHKWPPIGRFMHGVSQVVLNHGPWLAPLTAALITAMVVSLSRWTSKRRLLLERHFMPYAIYRDYYSAVFLVSISALMRSGTSLMAALSSVRGQANPWLRWHINRIGLALDNEAGNPAHAFNTGLFSPDLYFRISSYGERSSFPVALEKVGNQVVEKVGKSVKKRAASLNLILLGLSGALLATMITSVMLTAQEAQKVIRTQQRMQR